MARKKILWLCSWYPNRLEPYNGDFVQRHAIAASLMNDIHVMHLAGDYDSSNLQEELTPINPHLTEQRIYYPRNTNVVGRLLSYMKWRRCYISAVEKYIASNGIPDLVHVHVPWRDGIIARYFYKKYNIPYLVTEHWTIYQPNSPVQYKLQSPFFRNRMRAIARDSALLLTVSADLGHKMNEQVIRKNFSILPNVADTSMFFRAEDKPLSPVRFLHVSNMTYQKNVESIINTFARQYNNMPGSTLTLAGNADNNIRNLIDQLSIPPGAIICTGELPYNEVATHMRNADVLVMFSRFENSPCTIIEALCSGLPVIATNVGGINELLDGSNGILISEGQEKELALAMQHMYDNFNGFDCASIASNAAAKYSYQTISNLLDTLYEKYRKEPNLSDDSRE